MFKNIRCFLSTVLIFAVLIFANTGEVKAADSPANEPQGISVRCGLGSLEGWNINRLVGCDSLKLFEFPEGSSNYVGRFLINPSDRKRGGGRRAEVRDPHVAVNSDETWYRFKTLIPEAFPIDMEHSVVLSQWQEKRFPETPSRRPPIAHRLVNGEFRVTLWNDDIHDRKKGRGNGIFLYREPDYAIEKVHEFIYRIKWGPDKSGSIRAWKRECDILKCKETTWIRFIDYHGAVGYRELIGYYFKAGLYTVHEFSRPMIIYHTAYGRGPTPESIGLDASWNNR
ncbi:MAG: heparin lyase I family protein [Deltaproteobacteria bacterium]|nr:heparin lyase I family protein [Deltaproteobacteria bacterium]